MGKNLERLKILHLKGISFEKGFGRFFDSGKLNSLTTLKFSENPSNPDAK